MSTRNSRNSSGVVGVCWDKKWHAWRSRINVNGREILLGYSKDFIEAICTRKSAEINGIPKVIKNISYTGVLTHEILKQRLHYSPETGSFTWLDKFGNLQNGVIAGTDVVTDSGKLYISIKVFGTSYKAHRLASLYMLGRFPPDLVDHINGDGTCNRWVNLREVNASKNAKNKRLSIKNTSGFIGVSFMHDRCKWKAAIRVDSMDIYLGCFDSKEDAISARKKADIKYKFHQNHGSIRPL